MIRNLSPSLLLLATLLLAPGLVAQTPPFSAGFRSPIKLAFTHAGNLIVAEAGSGPNSGRISLVDRTNGARRTLIDALPSGIHVAEVPQPSGPAGLALHGSTLYLSISSGDSVLPGPQPGMELPNPAPSSPILSSILSLRANRSLDVLEGGFVLAFSDHALLKSGQSVTLTNGAGEELRIRLIVDFPDYVPEPRPTLPENVRLSNPFSMIALGQWLFVVDASLNLMRRVDVQSGMHSTVTTFAGIPNATPIGGPFMEPVPDAIRIRGNELVVGLLSGFPFAQGAAMIRRVSLDGSVNEPLITGLTSVIDVMPLGLVSSSPLLVLEFSENQLQGQPGRLRLVGSGMDPVTLAGGLITPTSMAVDQRTGEVFISHLGPGIITRVNAAATLPAPYPASIIPVAGTVDGAFGSRYVTSAQVTNPHPFSIAGRLVFRAQGRTAASDDPSIGYTLAPFETRSFADLAGALGASGLGSVDVATAVGGAPVIVTSVRDVQSPSAASVQIPLVASSQVAHAESGGAFAVADDPSTRMNLGIRTLDEPVTLELTEHGPSGAVVATATASFPARWFEQTPVARVLARSPDGGNTLRVEVRSGSAIVYATSTENSGAGMTIQILNALPE